MKGKPLFSRLQRWIFSISIFFLLIMSLARLAMYLYFRHISIGEPQFWPVMWMGVRYDMREISIMAVWMILLAAVPILHPFYSRLGKRCYLALWLVALIVFAVFYLVDVAHFAYLHVRLNAHVLEFFTEPPHFPGDDLGNLSRSMDAAGNACLCGFMFLVYTIHLSKHCHSTRGCKSFQVAAIRNFISIFLADGYLDA